MSFLSSVHLFHDVYDIFVLALTERKPKQHQKPQQAGRRFWYWCVAAGIAVVHAAFYAEQGKRGGTLDHLGL